MSRVPRYRLTRGPYYDTDNRATTNVVVLDLDPISATRGDFDARSSTFPWAFITSLSFGGLTATLLLDPLACCLASQQSLGHASDTTRETI